MSVTQIDARLGLSARRAFRAIRQRRTGDLLALVALALLFPSLAQASLLALRVPLGLLMAFYAPGYALLAALFPRRGDLDGVARPALSLGLSVATLPILALLLDTSGQGLRSWPIVASLSAWVILLSGVAAARRLAGPPEDAVDNPSPAERRPALVEAWGGAEERTRKWLALAGTLLAGALLAAGVASLLPDPAAHPTEFYLLSREGQAENYPREAAPGDELAATLGIANGELGERTYRVEVWAGDLWDAGRRELIARQGPIVLSPGQAHEAPISWQMPWPGEDQRVEFLLFADDDPEPYRRLHLHLDVLARPGVR